MYIVRCVFYTYNYLTKERDSMKKRFKKFLLSGGIVSLALFLSGCMQVTESGEPTGWFYDFLVTPTQWVINNLAEILPGGYGTAIVVLTIIVRLIILPLTLNQQRASTETQVKMEAIKPVTEEIQKDLEETNDPAAQQRLQQELMQVHEKAGISLMGGMGCLPLLIQIPIISMVFNAIRLSPDIANATFLGISLGERSILLAIIAGAIYLVQALLMIQGMPEEQRSQMMVSSLISPIMILVLSLSSPAGIALYWIVGGIFSVIQSFILNQYYKPRIQQGVKEELGDLKIEREKPKESKESKTVNPTQKRQNRNSSVFEKKGKRNEGKQNKGNKK